MNVGVDINVHPVLLWYLTELRFIFLWAAPLCLFLTLSSFTHGTISLKGFPEVNFSLYFSLFWRKSLVFSSGCNESTFERGPKYHFQCYCIHLAFCIFPAIWFQSLMRFVEDASYESRISDGCWTHPWEVWAMQNSFEVFFLQVKGFTAECSQNTLQ